MEKIYQIVDDNTQIVITEVESREDADVLVYKHGLAGVSIREAEVRSKGELLCAIRDVCDGGSIRIAEDRLWGYPQCMRGGAFVDIVGVSCDLMADTCDVQGCSFGRVSCMDITREELEFLVDRITEQVSVKED